MLRLEGKGTSHIQIDALIAFFYNQLSEGAKFGYICSNDLGHHRNIFVVLGRDVAQIFGARCAMFESHKRGVVEIDSTNELMVQTSINIIGISLQGGEMQRNHRAKIQLSSEIHLLSDKNDLFL